jgi:hypothetical protein
MGQCDGHHKQKEMWMNSDVVATEIVPRAIMGEQFVESNIYCANVLPPPLLGGSDNQLAAV